MNNFKEYGFEADFEGELLKTLNKSDDKIEVLIGYIIFDNQIITTKWDISGYCYFSNKFSLKPIKKEWYENPDNVGKLIVYDYFDDNRIGIFKCLHKDKGWIELYTLNGCKVDQKTYKVRPATKEEVLSLLVKE